jgi:hypothetical protein
MKRRHLLGAISLACASLIGSAAWAAGTATVDPSHGVVLINRGKGFSQIHRPARVRVGNSVMVGPDGRAVIAYNDGCSVNVEPGTVKTVAALSPCASGSAASADPAYSQSNGNWCRNNDDNNDGSGNNNGGWNSACVFWPVWGAGVGFITYEAISP